MSKITLSTVSELQAFPSAAANINSNSATLTTAMDNTLSRDGTNPNTMGAVLDMNSHRIINLPAPGGVSDPVRLQDVTGSSTIALSITLAGDVTSPTGNGTLATTIANNAVTNVKMADNSVGTAEIIAANVTNAKLATQANNTIKSNVSGSTASPSDNTITQVLDSTVGSTQGSLMYRNTSTWVPLTPGTAGQVLSTNGAGANPSWITSAAGSVITPEQYGAVGNGSTNDTVALQNFLAAAAGKTGVFTPGKTYMFSGFLIVQSNTYLVGYGSTIKALATAGINLGNLWLTDPTEGTAKGPDNVIIAGLTVNGNATARRAGGAFSGVGNAAGFYLISTNNSHLYDCKSIDTEADGFYIGGSTALGGVSNFCTFDNCYANTPGRNCYSVVGATACSFKSCTADQASFGAAHTNLSCGWDFEPDNAVTSQNTNVDCIDCKAIGCVTSGFNVGNFATSNIHCNWVSPYTQSCGIGYNGLASMGVRIIGARYFGNTTNFSNAAEAIPSFP